MPREKRKVIPVILSTAIFILMEVAALNMIKSGDSVSGTWISKGGHHVMKTLWGGSQSIRYYTSLKKTNEDLADENFHLRLQLEKYLGEQEVSLMDSVSAETMSAIRPKGFSWIPAKVVKVSNNKQHNYLILDKGSEDGVTPECGIITGKGVIGIVEVVGEHYCFALSFKNADVSVSARLGTDGMSGPLNWDGYHPSKALLKEIPLQNKFSQGDTVYTSGHSSIFPPEIPLGTVSDSKVVNGATYEISVDLFQDFSELRFVTIVKNAGREEIASVEETAIQEGL